MESETWSRLKQSCPNLLKKYESLLNQAPPPFWLKYDILDIYVISIIFMALIVAIVVKYYVKSSTGYLNHFNTVGYSRRHYGNPHLIGESAKWVNNLIDWIRCQSTAFTDAGVLSRWAKLLTDEAEKIDRNPELSIVKISFQNNLPYFTDFQTIQTCEKSICVHCFTSILELPISIILYPSISPIPLNLKILRLDGSVKFRINSDISCVDIEAQFSTTKSTKILSNIKISEMVSLERKLLASLSLAVLNFRIPLQFNLSNLCKVEPRKPGLDQSVSVIQNGFRTSPIQTSHYSEASLYNNKLLIKIIKACNLKSSSNVTFDPYCMISINEPYQRHFTSVVRNTCNPFFDEHYIFTISAYSKFIKFEIYCRKDKQTADKLIGKASLSIDDLRMSQSSKQTIPLTPDPNLPYVSSGTIIADFIFLDEQATNMTPIITDGIVGEYNSLYDSHNMDFSSPIDQLNRPKTDSPILKHKRNFSRLTVGNSPNPSHISLSSNNSPLHLDFIFLAIPKFQILKKPLETCLFLQILKSLLMNLLKC